MRQDHRTVCASSPQHAVAGLRALLLYDGSEAVSFLRSCTLNFDLFPDQRRAVRYLLVMLGRGGELGLPLPLHHGLMVAWHRCSVAEAPQHRCTMFSDYDGLTGGSPSQDRSICLESRSVLLHCENRVCRGRDLTAEESKDQWSGVQEMRLRGAGEKVGSPAEYREVQSWSVVQVCTANNIRCPGGHAGTAQAAGHLIKCG